MSRTKNTASAKKIAFERKQVNGKSNPKYVDVLTEDKPIAGQHFACVSFISPEKILKQKEIFFFEEFLKKWELNKSMEKFVQFLNFVSYKYNMSFDDLSNDFKDFVKEEQENINKSSMDDDYKTFVDNNEEELQKRFDIAHNFQTNVRGIKIRGCYPTLEEAELRAKMLEEIDNLHDINICPVGMWAPMDPDAYKTGRVEYLEEELNQLMSEKNKNDSRTDAAFKDRVKEAKTSAIKENVEKAEKSGNVLTQTVDENGNLIGINSANSQEFALREQENISTADICNELFEGENIITGKTDNGQSLLVSGPFANKKKDSMEDVE
jgi:hypothetical protein